MLPVLFYGVIAAGGVYSSASFTSTASELAAQIKRAKSNIVLASEDCFDVAIAAAKDCGISLSRVLILQSMGHRRELRCAATDRNYLQEPWSSDQRLDWERIEDPETLKNRTICLLYSSGTTGLPKGTFTSVDPPYIVNLKDRFKGSLILLANRGAIVSPEFGLLLTSSVHARSRIHYSETAQRA